MKDYKKPRKTKSRKLSARLERGEISGARKTQRESQGLKAYSRPQKNTRNMGSLRRSLLFTWRYLLRPRGWIFALAAIWVVAGLITGLLHLRNMPLAVVDIQGLERLGREEVLNRAGLRPGMPMGNVDSFQAASSLVSHPWIKTASVRRFFPDSLLIQLTERRPELRMELPQGLTALLDDDGVVLGLEQSGHTPAAGQRPLVLLRGLPYAPQPGQTIRDRLLDTARSAVSALDPYALAGSAAPDQTAVAGQVLVELGDPFRIGVQLPGPVRVLTPPEYIEEALEIYPILGRLLPDIVGKNREIDFSPLLPGRRVVIRPIR